MKAGLEWYKRSPAAFLGGVQGLTSRQCAVYSVVLDLIYVHGGAVNNDPKWISGWFPDLRAATVKTILAELVAMGKLQIEGGLLTQHVAKDMVAAQRALQQTRIKSGEYGGISSGFSRREASKTKALGEAKGEAEKSREEKTPAEACGKDTPSSAPAAPPVAEGDARARLLAAMGADPVSGLMGPNGRWLGTLADMAEAAKWGALGLTLEQQCAVVAERCAALRRKSPHWAPGRFAYFSPAMADFKAAMGRPMGPGLGASALAPPEERAKKLARWKRIGTDV